MSRSQTARTGTGNRRGFLGTLSSLAMGTGLIAGYGTFASIAGRFLFPGRRHDKGWMFMSETARLKPGDSMLYRVPSGAPVAVTRQGSSGKVEDFIALSSTCPHLGCQVHWEAHNNRFFCPCHNGTFDPQGLATGGPPGKAGQSLSRYPLKIENGLLFIQVPMENLAAERPGHDPCLGPRLRIGVFPDRDTAGPAHSGSPDGPPQEDV